MLLSAKHFTTTFEGRVEITHSRPDSTEHIIIRGGAADVYPASLMLVVDLQKIEVNGLDSPAPVELPTLDKKCCVDFSRRRA